MFSTPEFWVFIAFLLLIASFGKRAYLFMTQTLDEHSKKISDQLARADSLHDEALSLLNSYKKKHEDATLQAEKIIAYAKREALEFKENSERELEKFMRQKEKALLERIVIEQEEAKLKLRKEATDEAIKIVEHLLQSSPEERKKITEASLKEIANMKIKGSRTK